MLFIVFSLMVGVLFSGCSKSTAALVGSWSEEAYETGKANNFLVVGVSSQPQARKKFETELRDRLQRKRLRAEASLQTVSPDEEISKETFNKYFRDKNIDIVLVSQIVDATNAPVYDPGDQRAMLNPYYQDFYSYYRNKIVKVPEVGHFEQGRLVQVETTAFETTEGKPVWQCLSKSFDQGNTLKVIEDLAALIVKTMKEDRVIK